MHLELVFVLLFAVATGVALIARRFAIPYTVALVVAGIVLGSGDWVDPPHLTKDLLFAVFLPGLLFEAAFHIDFKKFWSNKIAIHSLAIPGVVVAILATGALLTPVIQGLDLEHDFRFIDGLVFGGIIAATDPIAVVAMFKSLGAPKRLGVLVEGESLLNDGTAVVLFGAIFAVAVGTDVTIGSATVDFIKTCGLGILIGAGVGYGGSKIIHLVDDPMIEITVTTVVAWGSFAVAEQIHVSGVLATVTAGLMCGNWAARTGMSPSTKIAAVTFWAYIAFALNSIVFLLIGFEVEFMTVLASWKTVLLAWLAATLARALVIGAVATLLRRTKEQLPSGWATVMCWGGIRGGVSMVLVLALPADFPHRQFLVNVVFGVVVVSILVQGLTMSPLLRRLGIASSRQERQRYEAARAEALALRAALDEIDTLQRKAVVEPGILDGLRDTYRRRLQDAEGRVKEMHVSDLALDHEERRRVERHLALVEKDRIMKAIHEGLATDDATAMLLADLDARLVALDDAHADPPEAVPPSGTDANHQIG
jgi:monovalent cation:H+ antiporter, CPA1 family